MNIKHNILSILPKALAVTDFIIQNINKLNMFSIQMFFIIKIYIFEENVYFIECLLEKFPVDKAECMLIKNHSANYLYGILHINILPRDSLFGWALLSSHLKPM